MADVSLAVKLDESREIRVAEPVRGTLRVRTAKALEGCTVVTHLRLAGPARTPGADDESSVEVDGGYDEPSVEAGPFDWDAGAHDVAFELPPIRGPASYHGRSLTLEWVLVAELKDFSERVLASAALPIDVARRDREAITEDVVGGYRDAPRNIAPSFEPELGCAHVEGPRVPKLSLGERIERALFGGREIEAQIQATPSRLAPGDTFEVTLFLFVLSAATIESATVALVHHESGGAKGPNALVVSEQPLTDRVDLVPGHRRFRARLTMPDDAASSYADETLVTEWVIRVVVQAHWDAPIVLEAVLTVA
jgi:hypothetical protein